MKKFKSNYYPNGKLESVCYYNESSLFHREDGPAVIEYFMNGDIAYELFYFNGNFHREDGPAVIRYKRKGELDHKSFYIHGKRHNENGPAIITYETNEKILAVEYYYNDKYVIVKSNKAYKKYIKTLLLR